MTGHANEAIVRVVNGPLVAPVLSRVVGMLAARAQCPVDRLDDALLVADAIAAHTQTHTTDGHVTVRLFADGDAIELHVGELGEGGARGLLADASLPGVGNVLERIADEVSIETGGDGREVLSLKLSFGT
ncbi:MAG: ATP-binding protein [Actinobacteria bacterium]|nr:MAG: ATP-binding protein [Actinomycetota bacterium]